MTEMQVASPNGELKQRERKKKKTRDEVRQCLKIIKALEKQPPRYFQTNWRNHQSREEKSTAKKKENATNKEFFQSEKGEEQELVEANRIA